jgi:hypothetical protein
VIASLTDNLPHTVLECLGAGIPFVASRVGGIPEMVADEDHDAVLFPLRAGALAERLRQALDDGVGTARPAIDFDANERAWVAWHVQLARRLRQATLQAPQASAHVETVSWRELPSAAPDTEYVLLTDENERLLPTACSTLMAVAQRTGADLVTCGVDAADSEGGPMRWVPLGASVEAGVFANVFGSRTLLVRQEALARVGGLPQDWDTNEGVWAFYEGCVASGLDLQAVPEALVELTPGASAPWLASAEQPQALRALAPQLAALPPGLQELALLAQSLAVANRDMEEALARQTKELNSVKSDRFSIRRERDLALKGRRLAVRRWRRYRSAYGALMNKSPLRAYRAVKRALLSLLGRSERAGEEQPGS